MSQSPFIDPNVPLISIFDLRGLVPSQVEQLVPLMNPQWQRPVISKIVDQMSGATQMKTGNRNFKIYRQPNDYPAATIDTRNTSGANLVLNFTSSSFQALPPNHLVVSSSGCFGQVIQASSGQIIIQFISNPNGNTSFTSADFAINELVSDRGVYGNINNRSNPATVFTLPTEYDNVIGRFDAGCSVSFEDANNKTYITTPFGQAYAMMKEMQTIQRMYQQYYSYMLSDAPLVISQNSPKPSSWLNQIKTMGGLTQPIAGVLTLQALRNTIRRYKAQGGFTSDEIVVTCGSQYLGDAQEALEPYVLTAGEYNVVGGEKVKGLNIYTYGFEGLTIKLICDPFLDNPLIWDIDPSTGFTKRSRSAIWMSTDRVKTENGGTLPFVSDYYFGKSADVHRWVVNGGYDANGNEVNVGSNSTTEASINFVLNKTTQIMNPAGCLYHGN